MTAIRKLTLIDFVALSGIAMIAFHIYRQYWFVSLVGTWVVNQLLPIAILGIVALVFIWREHRWPTLRVALPAMWIFLGLYLLCASVSSLVNEPNSRQVINWLVYAWSPAAAFLSIHGLKNPRDNEKVRLCR